MIIAQCQNCPDIFRTDYYRIGMTVFCPRCGASTLVQAKQYLKYCGPSGFEINYSDLMQLLTNPESRRLVTPMISAWFNAEVQVSSDSVSILTNSGQSLSLEQLHEAIQENAAYRYELYQLAMSIWR